MTTPSPHKLKWTVCNEYQDILNASTLTRLLSGEDLAEHKVVRALPSRTVSYLTPTSSVIPRLYLKEYHFTTFLESVKSTFSSPARREWQVAQTIAQKGVPTFTPLAMGEFKVWGLLRKNYLVSASIENAQSLKEYVGDHYHRGAGGESAERRKVIVSLAQFVRELHLKGVLHQDFHWGNILIKNDDQGAYCFYLMDLHRVTLKSGLNESERIENLASLNTAFCRLLRRTERLRFLKNYIEGDERWELHYPRYARLIEETTGRMMRALWHKREKRCLKDNKYFIRFKSDAYRGALTREFSSPELLDVLHDPDRAFSVSVSTVIKDSHTTSSCMIPLQISGKKVVFHIKRYNYQSFPYALKYLFRTSRGKRVWKIAHGVRARGVPVPQPVAFLEQRKGRLLIESFFITRVMSGSRSLVTVLQERLSTTSRERHQRKRALLHHGARLVQQMHERGICHGDLKASNILVGENAQQQRTLYLIDLDSTRITKSVKREQKIRDLARLNASLGDTTTLSTTDRLRFLRSYLKRWRRRDPRVRQYWSVIAHYTREKLKKAGRGRCEHTP